MAGQYDIQPSALDASGILDYVGSGVFVVASASDLELQGVTYAPSGAGTEIVIYNDGAFPFTVKHNAPGAGSARINLTSQSDHVLAPGAGLYGFARPNWAGWFIDNGGQ